MTDSIVYFPTPEELAEMLASKAATNAKDKKTFFESARTIANMRLRLVILQTTVDGLDIVDVMVTPAENSSKNVFPFLQER